MHGDGIREFRLHRPGGAVSGAAPFLSGYLEAGVAPALHAGLPSPYLTLIVTLAEPCRVIAHPDPAQPADDFAALIGGLHVWPATISHDGAQSGVQVALDPLAARAVLGLPAAELVMRDLHLDDVLGRPGRVLRERVTAMQTWPERFAAVEAFLAERLRRADGTASGSALARPEVLGAWRCLVARRGAVRIDELARNSGLGVRRFTELFRRELGLSPKTAARIARFDATRRSVPGALAEGRLAELAVVRGYADQAHLNRDFREFTGRSPRAWWAAEVRNVQGAPPAADGGCQDE